MYLTVETIRQELQDNSPGDNSIECDLAFSDQEILHAMKRAANAYNQLPPLGVDVVHPACLPDDRNNIFLNATLCALYNSARQKLIRNSVSWSTGGVTVDIVRERLQLYKDMQKELESWKEAAIQRKAEINRGMAWGSF